MEYALHYKAVLTWGSSSVDREKPNALHILSFQEKLKAEKPFLKSLLCQNLQRRKLILQKASKKQIRLLQKLISLFVRGEITVSSHLLNKLRRSKKLNFIEQTFEKLKKDDNLKEKLVNLAGVIRLFVKIILGKK